MTLRVPIALPITMRVMGKSIASRMIKGMERKKLMITPSTELKTGAGMMLLRLVTTSSTPNGKPIR